MTIEELLLREEGFVSHAYRDHLGYLTIGIGRLIDEEKGGGITQVEAFYLLLNDVDKIKTKLNGKLPWWRDLDDTRRTILISMAYQMGVDGLLSFKNTLRYVRKGEWKKAANGMRASKWARQTPGRAERMARAMESGEF